MNFLDYQKGKTNRKDGPFLLVLLRIILTNDHSSDSFYAGSIINLFYAEIRYGGFTFRV